MSLLPSQRDRFIWKWTSSGSYSVAFTYRAFLAGSTKLLGAKELWHAKAPPKVKLFFWLSMHRRLWTAERRARHGLQEDDACVLCDQRPEMEPHLFLGCVFARQVWHRVLLPLQLQDLAPTDDHDIAPWWLGQRRRIDKASRPIFDSLLLLVAWCLWKERNARTFDKPPSMVPEVVAAIVREGADWAAAGYAPMDALAIAWSQNSFAM